MGFKKGKLTEIRQNRGENSKSSNFYKSSPKDKTQITLTVAGQQQEED